MDGHVAHPAFAGLRSEASRALEAARGMAGEARRALGAVNWASLRVVEVLRCEDEGGRVTWQVLVEEAAPDSALAAFVHESLAAALPDLAVEVRTEW